MRALCAHDFGRDSRARFRGKEGAIESERLSKTTEGIPWIAEGSSWCAPRHICNILQMHHPAHAFILLGEKVLVVLLTHGLELVDELLHASCEGLGAPTIPSCPARFGVGGARAAALARPAAPARAAAPARPAAPTAPAAGAAASEVLSTRAGKRGRYAAAADRAERTVKRHGGRVRRCRAGSYCVARCASRSPPSTPPTRRSRAHARVRGRYSKPWASGST